MVLAHSLRQNGTRKQLVALVTSDSVSASTIEELNVSLVACEGRQALLISSSDCV